MCEAPIGVIIVSSTTTPSPDERYLHIATFVSSLTSNNNDEFNGSQNNVWEYANMSSIWGLETITDESTATWWVIIKSGLIIISSNIAFLLWDTWTKYPIGNHLLKHNLFVLWDCKIVFRKENQSSLKAFYRRHHEPIKWIWVIKQFTDIWLL